MNISVTDKTRGVFEIFIPGAFLFINFVGFLYFFPGIDENMKREATNLAANPILGSLILISFGYLTGILLRLMKTGMPDRWSGKLCWIFYDRCNPQTKKYYFEAFPYFLYIKSLCDTRLPPAATIFYDEVWGERNRAGGNIEFFNYCKIMINAADERSSNEVSSAEALSRYISGMLYALLFSFILALTDFFILSFSSALLILSLAYLAAIIVILLTFRFLRVKEVEAVFAATLRNYYEKKIATDILASKKLQDIHPASRE